MRDAQPAPRGDVTERVASRIAIVRRVRKLAATGAIEDDEEHAWEKRAGGERHARVTAAARGGQAVTGVA